MIQNIESQKIIMPTLNIGLTVFDRRGGIVHHHEEPGHSWTRNAWNMQLAAMAGICGDASATFGAGYMSTKNTAAAISSAKTSSITVSSSVPTTSGWANNAATAEFGIVVGTGATAFNIDNYVLVSPVTHGTGTGQMSYSAQLAPVQGYTAETKTWSITHKRNIINESAGAIVVAEIGLIWKGACFSGVTYAPRLMARDVLGATVTVAATELLVVEYAISMDFSTID